MIEAISFNERILAFKENSIENVLRYIQNDSVVDSSQKGNLLNENSGDLHPDFVINTDNPELPTTVCYHADERLAIELSGFFFGQGASAARCDDLLKTDIYKNLHKDIYKTHKDTIQEFLQPLETFFAKYNIDPKKYILWQTAAINTHTASMPINKNICQSFYQEMELRKSDWKHIISPIIGAIVIFDVPMNDCDDNAQK